MAQLGEFFVNHYFLASLWCILLILIVISYMQTAASGSLKLSPLMLSEVMNRENGQVVDVRAIADFNKGHIPGSINIPFTKIKDSAKDLEKYKDVPIIMVCNAGIQAGAAATILRSKGFKPVHVLRGGLGSWLGESLPLKKS